MDQVPPASRPGLLSVFWRHRLLVVLSTVLFGLAGWGLSTLQPTMYSAQASLLLDDPRSSSVFNENRQTVLDPARYVRNQAEYMTSTAVLTRTSELMSGRVSVGELRGKVTAQPSRDLDLVTINAMDPTAEGAAEAANSVAEAYELEVRERSVDTAEQTTGELTASRAVLQERLDEIDDSIDTASDTDDDDALSGLNTQRSAIATQVASLDAQIEQISVDAALYGSGVQLFESAEPPAAPAQPRPLGAALVAAFLGFLSAMGFAWWRTEHRQRADDRLDPGRALGVPLLGEVPEFSVAGSPSELPAHDARHTVAGEAYHFLVSSLGYAISTKGSATILITSAGPGDGKTVTAANLAIAAMRDGRRVLMIDADERARGLTNLTAVRPEPGLTDLADPQVSVAGATAHMPLGDEDALAVVPAGRSLSDPAGFFRTGAFRQAMARAKVEADLVIVDSPPLLAVSDTSAIASQTDGIVIVVSRGTPLRLLREVRERLDFIGTPPLGYVFNRADPRRAGYGSGDYGYGKNPEKSSRRSVRRGRRTAARV